MGTDDPDDRPMVVYATLVCGDEAAQVTSHGVVIFGDARMDGEEQ